MDVNTVSIDGRLVPVGAERNLLELIRKAGIDIPTFCYHSDLSVYGACRLCIVEILGRGIVTSCTVTPEPGMVVRTSTKRIRNIRRLTIELLLAGHEVDCPTCDKSATCQLLELASRYGISKVRYRKRGQPLPVDNSSCAVVRNPNKCVLCGDCVRVCSEIQGIGVLDFAHRGSNVQVMPAFGHGLSEVECVDCGQCLSVCPTGALTPKSQVDKVWAAIHNPDVTVVAQVAPAVRVGIGEAFGLPAGTTQIGQIAAALRAIGVDKVFDTAFAADLTVLEEGSEFLKRFKAGERLPQFTSCCPAWVKLVEQRYPDLIPNLSSCKSPQQMFGSTAKKVLATAGIAAADKPEAAQGAAQVATRDAVQDAAQGAMKKIFVLSIMPCTAKKFEASRDEHRCGGEPDVDAVITTLELAQMIREAGLDFGSLEPERLDSPFGFKSGAGVIFGTTGGVAEAVLRFAAGVLGKRNVEMVQFQQVRGLEHIREANVEIGGTTLRLAVAHTLAAAQELVEQIRSGERQYDLVEVMACPGGCIGGAGQPRCKGYKARETRQQGLYKVDTMLPVSSSEENPYVQKLYAETLGEPGSHVSHELLHTQYRSRRRALSQEIALLPDESAQVSVHVCVGTNCHIRGSHDLLHELIDYVDREGLTHRVDISASFCNESCDRGPTATVNGETLYRCTTEMLKQRIQEALVKAPV